MSFNFEASSCRYDTIPKVKFAPSLIVVTLCTRKAMFLPFDLAKLFHEDRCRELGRELYKLCNLSRNAQCILTNILAE